MNEKVSKHIEPDLAALRGEKGAAYDIIVLNAGIVDHLLGCEGAEDVTVAMERAKEAIDSGKALEAFELHWDLTQDEIAPPTNWRLDKCIRGILNFFCFVFVDKTL